MSDAKNLNDFFAQNSRKKKNNKKPAAAAKATPAAAVQTREEEVKEEATNNSPAVQPEEQKVTPAQDFADSSDDDSNTIVLNEGHQKIVDRKDIEAKKKTREEETTDAVAGWGLGSKLEGTQAQTSASAAQPSSARATGPSASGKINFGKPMFSRKQKGIMDQQDFPDLADAASGSTNNESAGQSKANSAMMFSGGAAARGPRAQGSSEENKLTAGPTKPVFRGKGKFTAGGASNEEMANSRMNYDFSKMRMSAATTKTAGNREAGGADGENRGDDDNDRRRGGPRQVQNQESMENNDDDDFEVVTDKKKNAFRRNI